MPDQEQPADPPDIGREPDTEPGADGSKISRLLGLVLFANLGLSAAILVVLGLYVRPAKDTIAFEIAKAVLQFGVFATVATAVSVLVFEYQRSRQNFDRDQETKRQELKEDQQAKERRREYRNELLKSVMDRAITSYNSVKRSRRLLRARGLVLKGREGTRCISSIEYDTHIEIINDAQLELEALVRDVQTSISFFSNREVEPCLRSMESYLRKLIGEYENRRGPDREIELSDLTLLDNFLRASRTGSLFKDEFAKPMQHLQKLIRQDLQPRERPGSA